MAEFSRTWWGQKFIHALESFTEPNRLGRGRTYARGGKVKSFDIKDGLVTAKVRGSVNPYFGVYKEPLYTTTIEFEPISKAKWAAVIALIASKASLISRLLLNEIPDNIEDSFKTLGLRLLPSSKKDFKTACSCPDYSNPCKHIAGVHYLIAAKLDEDPFLLFELRGLSREALKKELAKSPLGQALSAEMMMQQQPPNAVETYYTRPVTEATAEASLKDFWQGAKRLPQTIEVAEQSGVSAVLVKKQGDFPPFWHRDNSFLEVMEEFYERVKTKNKDLL
ncbi:SWIM zinc finger family protein [Leptothoe sp. PORK10 BA2]|uniref:SWIM zinc finger family protein n=1 Tax=Leptothoe sp. PORK10 BA2 TaxID=3110254 RepID=UPI002B1FBD5F|nr:SWIM zinc finger family protein [Leptothoe sp. PORK10 BA2]MEA5466643.1 SWIM zinc finger family protein [Leptothoe sp. PORK10 BA2]